MRKKSKRTTFLAGDFISEDAVRGALGRRRPTTPAIASEGADSGPAGPATADGHATPSAGRTVPLRRWSVAELIAGAIAPPRADGVGH